MSRCPACGEFVNTDSMDCRSCGGAFLHPMPDTPKPESLERETPFDDEEMRLAYRCCLVVAACTVGVSLHRIIASWPFDTSASRNALAGTAIVIAALCYVARGLRNVASGRDGSITLTLRIHTGQPRDQRRMLMYLAVLCALILSTSVFLFSGSNK